MGTAQAALAVAGGIITIAAAIGLAWPVFRAKTNTATIELLRSEHQAEREARIALQERCAAETAELRGRVEVLSSTFAVELSERVAAAISTAIAEAFARQGVTERRGVGRA